MMSVSPQVNANQKWLFELKIILAFEVFTVPFVILVFRNIEPRILAAALAGSWFCVLGTLILWRAGVRPRKWRSFLFLTALIFSMGVAYPMLVVRAFNFGRDFSELSIWGIPGPRFHQLSNFVFLAMVAATVIEFISIKNQTRISDSQKPAAPESPPLS